MVIEWIPNYVDEGLSMSKLTPFRGRVYSPPSPAPSLTVCPSMNHEPGCCVCACSVYLKRTGFVVYLDPATLDAILGAAA